MGELAKAMASEDLEDQNEEGKTCFVGEHLPHKDGVLALLVNY